VIKGCEDGELSTNIDFSLIVPAYDMKGESMIVAHIVAEF